MNEQRYEHIIHGTQLYFADGRAGRPDHIAYRESYHASYQGPYTKAWDGLKSNRPGMVGNDPLRGFDLTMHAGEAAAGSYTTRDIASAEHGRDYRPAYTDWKSNKDAHPSLMLPGRTALWHGVRFDLLRQGEMLKGMAGAIIQDWRGIEFETMQQYGNTAKSMYTGGGFVIFNRDALFPKIAQFLARFQKKGPFSEPVAKGVAPLYMMFAQVNGYLKTRILHIDPDLPHELACHWSHDAQTISFWLDRICVMQLQQGQYALPLGMGTGARLRFHECGFHVDCWQDNGAGGVDVQGAAGNPDHDQVYSVESITIIKTELILY